METDAPAAEGAAEGDDKLAAVLAESAMAEKARTDEDQGAANLVDGYCAELFGAWETFEGLFNPPRDGDCLMSCAVEHDFAGSAARPAVGTAAETVGTAPAVHTTAGLRLAVVARVREAALAALAEEAASKAAELRRLCKAKPHAGGREAGEVAALKKTLAAEVAALQGSAVAAAEAYCANMCTPGVVMGEDELQALADVRQACVQVRSIICVKESSDYGAVLDFKTYHPKPLAPPAPGSPLRPALGRGDTLVVVQEMRAHRMSHFQLARLPLPSPPPAGALHPPTLNEVD